MKRNALMAVAAFGASAFIGIIPAKAQSETVAVAEETAVITEVPCKTHYYSTAKDNWFIQIGAGINSPFVENYLPGGGEKHHITTTYNFGFGKWFSPYIGWRLGFNYAAIHWDNEVYSKARSVNANFDFMWDMFNSVGGVNSRRPFSIVPFVGLGGTYNYHFSPNGPALRNSGSEKTTSWTLPVSVGMQLRFRLCQYVDFFAEGRVAFYGDNYNNASTGAPVDMNISAIGGFSFNIGGCDFRSYNPCDYLSYVNDLNNQVNDLRGALASTSAALAAAEAQLPCPEVAPVTNVRVVESAPLMATVRFSLNSSTVAEQDMVSVYNTAKWLKDNPEQNVVIVGYADRDTGSSDYNMNLSKRRAQAVYDALVNKYGINPDRLSIQAEGSNVQPYDVNNWNRVVIFNPGK